jgi:hypothetical protein
MLCVRLPESLLFGSRDYTDLSRALGELRILLEAR